MKTKNIFRMLLVAAALLMGANNVKPETYEYEKETFASLTSTSIIRVNCSNINENYWQITFATKDGQTPDFAEGWGGGSDWGSTWYYTKSSHSSYLINNSYFDLKCDQNTVNKLSNYGLKIETQGLTVTSVTIVGGSSKTTPILSFGEGAQETYNITYGDSFTGPTATCNIDGLEVNYTSSDLTVAEVGTYTGALTIKKAGTTVITAHTDETSDYNAASISYTLNIAMAYSVTVNAVSNGSVSVDKSSTAAGQTVTITTTPNSGYELGSISVKDASNNTVTLSGSGNTRTFTMPASNVTVSAEFTVAYSAAEADKHSLTFETPDYCAATWDSSTNTFTWGNRDGWNTAWTFMAAQNISGDLSNWTHLHLHVSNWNNASAQQLRVVFKKNDGSSPPSGPTKEFVVSPNASGNIDLNLVGVNWGDCDITSIQDLTIYGCTRDNGSQEASVVVTDAYYVTATETSKQDVTLAFSPTSATATMGEAFTAPTLTATSNGETVTLTGITYSSSAPGVATVNESGVVTLVAAGTTTITASFAGNDTYNAASASYTLTVNAAAPSADDYIDVSDDGNLAYYGYRTYVTTTTVDFSRSIGVEAYYATGLNTARTDVEFTQILGTCPANVPLLLKKKNGANEFKLLKSTASATAPTGNKLQPGTGDTVSGDDKYVLTYHSGSVVFAEVDIQGATVDTEHAYLDLSGSSASGRLRIKLNGESTGISSLQSDERSLDGAVYNLRGQRVEHPTKGLYIINGKKVVIK